MKRTGVYATEEEVKEITVLAKTAESTPVISGCEESSGDPWELVYSTCHKYALAHGLPEFSGHYGIDLSNGEFLEA